MNSNNQSKTKESKIRQLFNELEAAEGRLHKLITTLGESLKFVSASCPEEVSTVRKIK